MKVAPLELDVRAALGAGTWRIARSLLVEHALLAVLGGLVGLLVAYGALQALLALAPQRLPRLDEISLDARSLAFGLLVTVGAAAIFSVAPLLRAARTRLATRLRGSRGASSGAAQHRTQNALVVGQVALALVLLVSSGLMIRTFEALRAVEPGFTGPESLQTFRIAVPPQLVPDAEGVWRAHQNIAEALRAIPGVESVGFTNALPMEQVVTNWDGIQVEGRDNSLDSMALRVFNSISPGYLAHDGDVRRRRPRPHVRGRRRYASRGARLRVAGARALVVAGSGGRAADSWRRWRDRGAKSSASSPTCA